MGRNAKKRTTAANAICGFLREVSEPCPGEWLYPLTASNEDVRYYPEGMAALVAQLEERFDRAQLLRLGILRDNPDPRLQVHPGLGDRQAWQFFSGSDRRPADILTQFGYLFDRRPPLLVRYADPEFRALATHSGNLVVVATLRDSLMWQTLGHAAVIGHGLDHVGREDLGKLRQIAEACHEARFAEDPQAPCAIMLINWSFRAHNRPYSSGMLDPVIQHLRKLDKILNFCHDTFRIATIDDDTESSFQELLQYGTPADIQKFLAGYLDGLDSLRPRAPRLADLGLAEAVNYVLDRRRQALPMGESQESLLAKFNGMVTKQYVAALLEDADLARDPIEKNRLLTVALLTDQLQARLLPRFVNHLLDPTERISDDDKQLDVILRLAQAVEKMSAQKAQPPQASPLAVFPRAKAS